MDANVANAVSSKSRIYYFIHFVVGGVDARTRRMQLTGGNRVDVVIAWQRNLISSGDSGINRYTILIQLVIAKYKGSNKSLIDKFSTHATPGLYALLHPEKQEPPQGKHKQHPQKYYHPQLFPRRASLPQQSH